MEALVLETVVVGAVAAKVLEDELVEVEVGVAVLLDGEEDALED